MGAVGEGRDLTSVCAHEFVCVCAHAFSDMFVHARVASTRYYYAVELKTLMRDE